jgi:hypothetical protein
LLLVVELTAGPGIVRRGNISTPPELDGKIGSVVDTLLARYGIEKDAVRAWHAKAAGETIARIEERIQVGRSFLSLNFNHDLDGELARLGAHVVATERSKGNSVVMHLVHQGRTLRSLVFVEDPEG